MNKLQALKESDLSVLSDEFESDESDSDSIEYDDLYGEFELPE